jgi:hypothetical protein
MIGLEVFCHISCEDFFLQLRWFSEISMIVFQLQDANTPLVLARPDMVLPLEVKVENF